MKFKRKLLDLTNQRATQVAAAETAMEGNDRAVFDAAMAQVSDLDGQIAQVNALIAAQESTPVAPPAGATPTGTDIRDDVTTMRASNEYTRAFCDAVRNRVSPTSATGDHYGLLLNALTEGVNENGGFLVPVDLQTAINEQVRQMVSLRNLVTVEPVTTLTGYRVIDKAPTKGFSLVAEMGEIPLDDQPEFSRIGYTCKDYGLIVPISNDLLSDNDAGLMAYLARWIAKKKVITENVSILAKLALLAKTTVVANSEFEALKSALNKGLDPSIALNAVLLTNQSGYDCLDQRKDTTGRPLLQPDLTAGTGYQLKQKPITAVSDSILANAVAGSPLYVGDLKQYLTIFDRQVLEFTTTSVGGSAWRTNSTEGRAIMRQDIQVVDAQAVKALALAGGLPPAG